MLNPRYLTHHCLCVVNLRVKLPIRKDPLPVEVHACYRAPIITTDDTIWVHAGHKFHDEVRKDRALAILRLLNQRVQEAFKNGARISLTWVHPSSDKNDFALGRLQRGPRFCHIVRSNCDFGNWEATYSSAEQLPIVANRVTHDFFAKIVGLMRLSLTILGVQYFTPESRHLTKLVLNIEHVSYDFAIWVWLRVG